MAINIKIITTIDLENKYPQPFLKYNMTPAFYYWQIIPDLKSSTNQLIFSQLRSTVKASKNAGLVRA
ncbi:MAG: hypothetical protein EB015_12680 [Methylocystaceae bacterium]|nr:hypothetical protein [Methylocystaceae bacterium]